MKSLGRSEIVKKAMWLYPKVSGFSPSERWGHSTCCYNGVVYIFGGCCGGLHFSDVLTLNLDTMTWKMLVTTGQRPGARDSLRMFLHSLHLRIRNLQVPETFVIRISNISVDTAESTIHTICMGYGSISGLSKTKEGTVDVLFKVKDSSARENILKRLNDTSYDNSQWSAEIRQESTDSTDTVNKADVQLGAGAQLTNCLEEILMQTNVKKIYLQDLLNSQQLIRHLEENPTS